MIIANSALLYVKLTRGAHGHLQSWVTGWVMGPLCVKLTKALTLILCVLPCWTEREIYGNSINHLTSLSLCVHTFVVHCQPLCPKKHVCYTFILSIISCVISHRSIPRIYTHNNHTLRWRHNERDYVSNHQPRHCLLNRLFGRRSKKTSKLRVTGLCAGNSPGPVNSPHKWPVTRKMFPFDDVIMQQDEFGMPVQLSTNAIIVTGVTQQAMAYDICTRIL